MPSFCPKKSQVHCCRGYTISYATGCIFAYGPDATYSPSLTRPPDIKMDLAAFAADTLEKMDKSAGEQINIRGVTTAMDAATDAFLADCMEGHNTAPNSVAGARDRPHRGDSEPETAEDGDMSDSRLTASPEKRKTSRAERLAYAREVKAQKARSRKNTTAPQTATKASKRVMHYWAEDEETALLAALEVVGPKWTEMVRMYGEGGSVDESLKGRKAIDLHNKAARLKKKLVERGEDIPQALAAIKVHGESGQKRLRRGESGRDAEEAAANADSRPKQQTLESGRGRSRHPMIAARRETHRKIGKICPAAHRRRRLSVVGRRAAAVTRPRTATSSCCSCALKRQGRSRWKLRLRGRSWRRRSGCSSMRGSMGIAEDARTSRW